VQHGHSAWKSDDAPATNDCRHELHESWRWNSPSFVQFVAFLCVLCVLVCQRFGRLFGLDGFDLGADIGHVADRLLAECEDQIQRLAQQRTRFALVEEGLDYNAIA